MTVWLCGFLPRTKSPNEWELVSICSSREIAESHCRDDRFFITPVKLDRRGIEALKGPPEIDRPRAGRLTMADAG